MNSFEDFEIEGLAEAGGPPVLGSIAMHGDEYVHCNRCGFGGCDVRVSGCGCTLHARCVLIPKDSTMSHCPICGKHTDGLVLFPMSFREIDEAKRTTSALMAAPKGRGRKRKSIDTSSSDTKLGTYVSERRTGRWTTEEIKVCDMLQAKFESGELPLVNGMKLNEFLGNMLKSKQSRLTKKMKNAKLSSKVYQRSTGGIMDPHEAREFSEFEDQFFQAVQDLQERAEIKFHMQREWREQFSQYCVSIGQSLDADEWLRSVEEMDRRLSQEKDAARMAKRKLMMGFALRTDCKNPDHGVFIEKTAADNRVAQSAAELGSIDADQTQMLQFLTEESKHDVHADINGKSSLLHSSPFLAKTVAYMQRHGVPFEHVDLWVPSFVPSQDGLGTTCRLCYAGSATVDEKVAEGGKARVKLSQDEEFNFFAFGDYSQKFSFDVGCGLPGRVYESGRPTWEQSVHNAPHHHFERCGGATQWGIKTVLGIPIASPNVGRIVVTLYSCHDRDKDQDLVGRLSEEFTRLLPSPKWKLVVDVGDSETQALPQLAANATGVRSEMSDASSVTDRSPQAKDARVEEVVTLLGELMPSDPNSPFAPYLSGFMSLRLLLLRPSKTPAEEDLARTMLDSFTSYNQGGRSREDIGVMLARDYMFVSQQRSPQASLFFSVGQGEASAQPPTLSEMNDFSFPEYQGLDVHNSPALAPIPGPPVDNLSIVSS